MYEVIGRCSKMRMFLTKLYVALFFAVVLLHLSIADSLIPPSNCAIFNEYLSGDSLQQARGLRGEYANRRLDISCTHTTAMSTQTDYLSLIETKMLRLTSYSTLKTVGKITIWEQSGALPPAGELLALMLTRKRYRTPDGVMYA